MTVAKHPAADLVGGRILPTVVKFSAPLTFANLLQQSYLLVDGVIVGRLLGVHALAAVGVAQPLYYLADGAFLGVATGFSIRAARLTGGGERQELSAVAAGLAAATLGCALACLGMIAAFTAPLLRLMGVPQVVATDCRLFILVVACGFPVIFAVAAVCALLRGIGETRLQMRLMTCSSLGNIGMVWLYVAGLHLGLAGAALATITVAAATTCAGLLMLRKTFEVRIAGVSLAELRREATTAIRLGFPLALQHILIALGIMVLIWIVAPLGTDLLAAVTIVGRLEFFASTAFLDFSGALTVFVAQNLAANRLDRVRRAIRSVPLFAAVLSLAISVLIVLLGPTFAIVSTSDPVARHLMDEYILVTYPFFICYAVMAVVHGALNGIGQTSAPLVCTVVSFVIVRLPLSYLLRVHYGAPGPMLAVDIGWLVGALYTAYAARRYLVGIGR
jgi:putative MATE family efflux protein